MTAHSEHGRDKRDGHRGDGDRGMEASEGVEEGWLLTVCFGSLHEDICEVLRVFASSQLLV